MTVLIGVAFFCGVLLAGSDGAAWPWANFIGLGVCVGCVWLLRWW